MVHTESKGTAAPAYCGAAVHERSLSNGMRVLVAERHLDPVVAVMVWYDVGARHEPFEVAGVSHFLEHMMFKGTETRGVGAIDLATTSLGGSNNAFTTPDHTAYWFEFASDRWEEALAMEADRMQSLLLDPEEFDSEKQVVLEELSMGEDDPWRSLSRRVGEVLYGNHPYARPVIGYRDTLVPMTVEAMRAHYDRFYRPGNATLVIAGDVEPDAAVAAAERHFGGIADPDGGAGAVNVRPAPDLAGVVRVETTWDDNASRLILAWPGATFGSDDDFALDVAVTVLTSGKLSRLFRRFVIDEGLATSVSANNDARKEAGGFWLYAEAVAGVDTAALEDGLFAEIERLRTEAVTDAELARAKKLLAAGQAYESETITEVAETLGEYATDLDWRDALSANERREAVTAEALRDVCARLLDPTRRVVAWSRPRGEEGAA
ncbi:MAG: pitrilysin family protein [Planctomycetota bacterium]